MPRLSKIGVEPEIERQADIEHLAHLNYLRFVAMQCRCKRRARLFEACATLHVTRNKSRDAFAEALMRCLGEALGRAPELRSPGTFEQTFDEQWLLQLVLCCAAGDQCSVGFLMRSRVPAQNQRLLKYLVTQFVNLSEFS